MFNESDCALCQQSVTGGIETTTIPTTTTTTTPKPSICWVNGKNPCNFGSCLMKNETYSCLCFPGYKGKDKSD